jgi:hypothetical protein
MESSQKRMPVTIPELEGENWTPSSTELRSAAVSLLGTAVLPNKLERAVTLPLIPGDGVSVLRLSSVARDIIVYGPATAFQLYIQLVVPDALNQVVPPFTDTSTPATFPPVSLATPLIVTGWPSTKLAPLAGVEIDEVGGVVSVDATAGISPDCNEPG